MFNVTILKLKDIIKFIVGLLIIIVIIFLINKSKNSIPKKSIRLINNKSLVSCLDQTLPVVAATNREENKLSKQNNKNVILEKMLKTQISSIQGIENIERKEEQIAKLKTQEALQGNIQEQEGLENEKNGKIQKVAQNDRIDEETEKSAEKEGNNGQRETLQTQVITKNPLKENFNTQYGKVKIKNGTSYTLTEEMLTPDITVENKNITIFHTHTSESYTPSEKYPYTPTGTYRTTDTNFTVARVGTELENQLKMYNRNVVHSMNCHDYPAYNGSYTRSLATVQELLKTNPSDIIIDLHRDAIGSRSDYAPTVKIGEKEEAAQIMFVIGTNAGGLWHPNWNQNLKFAIKVQEKAEEMYPGLFKPIMLTNSRYNQHVGKYACIMEVGATGNTLEQCLTSMKYLAKVLNEVVK